MAEAEAAFNRCFSPDEPKAVHETIMQRERAHYRARRWATRAHLWVDRVATAWLIQRFIDPEARFLWLSDIKACPEDAVGFDFDGAEFTHVQERVTFEVLLESFALTDDTALQRLAALVHFLDVGGLPVPEAAGFAAILTGARTRLTDDDAFSPKPAVCWTICTWAMRSRRSDLLRLKCGSGRVYGQIMSRVQWIPHELDFEA